MGDVEGRRNVTMFNSGVRGLVVPQSLFTGGSSLTISLFPRTPIFDLYIDRMELSYPPIPEPATPSLMIAGLAVVGGLAWRAHRRP
ncbi:PEP-CTERM sorting domain-containing protein [Azohydromonas australica]|uniref:PEP-CTERM sorting domain-containing protein n=1 Tax=Azohydromonas australica TaxID=364039 RepID=UPI000427127B|nr:PEP-CTERM sorting domain-containing protein [Azohydromonas australica]